MISELSANNEHDADSNHSLFRSVPIPDFWFSMSVNRAAPGWTEAIGKTIFAITIWSGAVLSGREHASPAQQVQIDLAEWAVYVQTEQTINTSEG